MSAKQGTIEAKDVDQMVAIVTKLTVSGVNFDVKDNGNGGWIIEITGAQMYSDELIDDMYEQKDTPHWECHCGHPEGSYVGSILSINHALKEEWLDVYVYIGALGNQDVCIRFGNEGSEYHSPGSILNVIRYGKELNHKPYDLALHLIRKHGQILFVRNE